MKGDELSIAGKSELSDYVCDANEAFKFHLVREAKDLQALEEVVQLETQDEDGNPMRFEPEMTHQIYGEHERIFGYRNLSIELFLSCGSLKGFLRMNAEQTISSKDHDGINPDPIIEPVSKILGENQLCKSLEEFKTWNRNQELKFKPMGDKLEEWKINEENGVERCFEVYHCKTETPGLKEYHENLQMFIMFFIDAASYIDVDDPNWNFFLLFERFVEDGNNPRYAICGYMTVYNYYAYPEHLRPRISQMLILPPFQKRGHGAKLLQAVQRFCNNAQVIDIAVEDPSDDFIRLRDFVDSKDCQSLKSFDPENLKKGFSPDMVKEAREKYKMGKKQTRKVYEILRLKCTDRSNEKEYKAYRVDVKGRLNLPYQKEERQLEKLKKVLKPDEFAAATVSITNKEQKFENLQSQYQELEDHYIQVIERLAAN